MLGLSIFVGFLPILALGADVGVAATDTDAEGEPVSRYAYELNAYMANTVEGAIPETSLLIDPELARWNVNALLRPRETQGYMSGGLTAAAEWDPADWLSLNVLLDSGELRDGQTLYIPTDGVTSHGNPLGDELASGSFICELAAELTAPAVAVQLGRFRSSVGSGLVYDDFGTGAKGSVDFEVLGGGPWSLELGAVVTGRRFDQMTSPSPLVWSRVGWNLSWFESLGLFASVFVDRSGESAELVKYAIAELDPGLSGDNASQNRLDTLFSSDPGNGTIGFIGIDGLLYPLQGLSARATALWSPGIVHVSLGDDENQKVNLSAYAADIELRYEASSTVDVGLLGFALSGSAPPPTDGSTYHAFIAVAPYWIWTGLFFSGGINQGLQPRRSASAGINGHGVLGAGPVLTFTSTACQLDLRASWLRAWVSAPADLGSTGKDYGLELDGSANFDLLSWLSFGVETDFLIPGSYFPTSRIAYRTLALLRGSYGR